MNSLAFSVVNFNNTKHAHAFARNALSTNIKLSLFVTLVSFKVTFKAQAKSFYLAFLHLAFACASRVHTLSVVHTLLYLIRTLN